jgi:hypothetical protein
MNNRNRAKHTIQFMGAEAYPVSSHQGATISRLRNKKKKRNITRTIGTIHHVPDFRDWPIQTSLVCPQERIYYSRPYTAPGLIQSSGTCVPVPNTLGRVAVELKEQLNNPVRPARRILNPDAIIMLSPVPGLTEQDRNLHGDQDLRTPLDQDICGEQPDCWVLQSSSVHYR